ncbi:MAG: hypothetical protein ACT4PN_15300, partial [Nitrospiraceae bacterium]
VIAAVEKVISPLTKHLGWRTDLSLNTVLEGTSLRIARNQRVNPLRLWALVECINGKDQQTNGNGASHSVAGYVNGNGTAGFANGNGNGRYSPEHAH